MAVSAQSRVEEKKKLNVGRWKERMKEERGKVGGKRDKGKGGRWLDLPLVHRLPGTI